MAMRLNLAACLLLLALSAGAQADDIAALTADVRALEIEHAAVIYAIEAGEQRLAGIDAALATSTESVRNLDAALTAIRRRPAFLALFDPQGAIERARRAAYIDWLSNRVVAEKQAREAALRELRQETAKLGQRREALQELAAALELRRRRLLAQLPMRDGEEDVSRLQSLSTLLAAIMPQMPALDAEKDQAFEVALSPAAGDRRRAEDRPGIVISGPSDRLVYAPAEAVIRYAAPFRRYAGVLILEHNDGYHSVMTGLARMAVETGDRVTTGDVLGAVGGSEIYFELRRGGHPVDVAAYLPVSAATNAVASGNAVHDSELD